MGKYISKAYKEHGSLYFKNGLPKKKYMLCEDPEYIRGLRGPGNTICGGLSCPYYRTGCRKDYTAEEIEKRGY